MYNKFVLVVSLGSWTLVLAICQPVMLSCNPKRARYLQALRAEFHAVFAGIYCALIMTYVPLNRGTKNWCRGLIACKPYSSGVSTS